MKLSSKLMTKKIRLPAKNSTRYLILCHPIRGVRSKTRLNLLKTYAAQHRKFSFRQLLTKQSSRVQVIVTFLSILELMKMGYIHIRQEELFDDIQVDVVQEPDTWMHLTEFADE